MAIGFMGQQPAFGIKSTGITCQAAICADDPMAGYDDGNGIPPDRTADRLGGKCIEPPLFCNLL